MVSGGREPNLGQGVAGILATLVVLSHPGHLSPVPGQVLAELKPSL